MNRCELARPSLDRFLVGPHLAARGEREIHPYACGGKALSSPALSYPDALLDGGRYRSDEDVSPFKAGRGRALVPCNGFA